MIALCVFCTAHGADLTQLAEVYADSVVHITTIGHLYDGTRDQDFGTGFFVSKDGYIVTVKHIIPREANYKSREFLGRLRSPSAPPFALTLIGVDDARDVALLRVTVPPDRPPMPVARPLTVKQGSWVGILGFQLDNDLLVGDGRIRSLTDVTGKWVSSVAINPGGSGSPIFDVDGRVVGIAWGSLPKIKRGDGPDAMEVPTPGTNYVMPFEPSVADIFKRFNVVQPAEPPTLTGTETRRVRYDVPIKETVGALGREISTTLTSLPGFKIFDIDSIERMGVPIGQHDTRIARASWVPSGSDAVLTYRLDCPACASAQSPVAEIATVDTRTTLETLQVSTVRGPPRLLRRYDVSVEQDDHLSLSATTKPYREKYLAENGYRIASARFLPASANHATKPLVEVSDKGDFVAVSFELQSGPVFDRWRGWLQGTIVTQQVRR